MKKACSGISSHVPSDDLLEALDRVGEGDVSARDAGELLGDVEGLGEEALDLARAVDRELVFGTELVHAEDRDDVLQLLVALEDLLDPARDGVVLLADDARVEDARGGGQGVDRRVDALLDDAPREDGRRVEVGEGGRGRRVREVVGGDVDRLDRGDGALLRRRYALLEGADLVGERRLVADRAGYASEEGRDLAARLDEAEDVVDEEEDVLAERRRGNARPS